MTEQQDLYELFHSCLRVIFVTGEVRLKRSLNGRHAGDEPSYVQVGNGRQGLYFGEKERSDSMNRIVWIMATGDLLTHGHRVESIDVAGGWQLPI